MYYRITSLLDRRGRVIWASDESFEGIIFDRAVPEDRANVEECFMRCVVRGQTVRFQARWVGNDGRSSLYVNVIFPVETAAEIGSVAAVAVSNRVPNSYLEFTEQDRELLGLLARDMSILEISEKMGRSPSTIDNRIRSLKQRLRQRTLHGLVAAAVRGRLVSVSLEDSGLTVPASSS